MKATIEIPDDLYRRVKAKSALHGRAIREVTMELYQRWLADDIPSGDPRSAEEWLDEWIALGEEALRDAPPGPTAGEISEAGRDRLERR